ncbi:S8 family peptidase [Microbacterium trichothecenolyticum]|uniref:Subtilisin family serine protease n=1 Tax=Microbacterium trichothecenolyticum TaxID=69370 RepID=A0ABU0TUE5_MICTR|nr:S8 family peptidase [Microbacterium trichothecenolyticum]MDQ1122567.1 subtilisin family serine protease [Microbacterium trichothecenolyticum]
MSTSSRPRRWLVAAFAGLVAMLAVVGVIRIAPPAVSDAAASASTPAPPSPGPASAEASADAVPTFAEQLPVPPGASDEERRRIELSYSLVAIPDDRLDDLRAAADGAIGAQSLGGTTYVAVPAGQVDAVRARVPESAVTPNALVEATADQTPTPSWGLDAIDTPAATQDSHYLSDTTGAGTTVYVVDTGIQSTHPDFGGRVDAAEGHTEVADGNGTEDCNGHGTHVAGTVGSTTYGVAKATRLVPVRVMGCDGQGTFIAFLYALIWIYNNHTGAQSVITMSLGLPQNDTANQLIQIGVDQGYVMTSAAGNETDDACKYSPGSATNGITVGAIDSTRTIAWYSNYGTCVTLFAPGSDITSTWIGSSTNTISGTSMATPHVAGLAARMLQEHPTWGTPEVKAALTSTAGASGTLSGLPVGTANIFASIPGVPRVTAVTAAPGAGGQTLSWTVNDIGTVTSFAVTVTDTTTGRVYPVDIAGVTTATVFLDETSGHAYTVSVGATGTLPTGVVVTSAPVTTTFTGGP